MRGARGDARAAQGAVVSAQPRISASRVAMMLGESKWGTQLSLYHELRGEGPPQEDNELLTEGREYEPAILTIGARKFHMRSVEGPKELAHGDLIGHPDGYVIDADGKLAIAEAKHLLFADVGEEAGWGKADTDEVPMAYWLQCQTYGWLLQKCAPSITIFVPDPEMVNPPPGTAVIKGAQATFRPEISDTVYLFARLWFGLRRYRIKVDPEVCARIESDASAFLDRVARGEPPLPTTGHEFRTRWQPDPAKSIDFTAREWEILKARQQLKAQIKLAEEEVEKLDMQLLGYMQDASIGKWNGKKVLGASADRAFDEAAFQVAHPDVYAQFLRKLDKTALGKERADLYEQFLVLPPAENQIRKLRPAKGIEEMQ